MKYGKLMSEQQKADVLDAVEGVLDSEQLSVGEWTTGLENEWYSLTGLRTLAVSSGTVALELAARYFLGKSGGTILIPAMTVPMVKWAVQKAGFVVRTYDVDGRLPVPKVEQVVRAIDESPRHGMHGVCGVVIVHTAGIVPPDIKAIVEECHERDVVVIEDCSHAHLTLYKNKMAGTFGDVAVWSMYPTKVLFTSEGGLLASKNEHGVKEAMMYANQSKKRGYCEYLTYMTGYNCRMSELAAAMAHQIVATSNSVIDRRRDNARIYNESGILSVQDEIEGLRSTFYKFTVRCDARKLRAGPLPMSGDTHWRPLRQLDGCSRWANGHVNMPLTQMMSPDDIKSIAKRYVDASILRERV